jgi:hypothetical protein
VRKQKYFTRRDLNLAQQAGFMRAAWPQFTCKIQRDRLVCRGPIRPLAICAEYRARIELERSGLLKVHVDDPPLTRRAADPDTPIPHVYGANRPCLYLPKAAEWTPAMPIATTIVPWLALWLFHYEQWQATGVWEGGGVHPIGNVKP